MYFRTHNFVCAYLKQCKLGSYCGIYYTVSGLYSGNVINDDNFSANWKCVLFILFPPGLFGVSIHSFKLRFYIPSRVKEKKQMLAFLSILERWHTWAGIHVMSSNFHFSFVSHTHASSLFKSK